MRGRLLSLITLACTPSFAVAQLGFEDVTTARGLGLHQPDTLGMGTGVAAADYDDDGDIDLFIPQDELKPHLLYRNLGDGYFEEIAGAVGLDIPDRVRVALWVDYDGDRDLDLLLGNDDFVANQPTYQWLFRQDADGNFTDVSLESGLSYPSALFHRGGFAAGDINNDGYLDLYSANYRADDALYLNNRDGTFTDIAVSAGIAPVRLNTQFQPVFVDVNRDGWMDIYVAVDFFENNLWINQGDNTFVDVAVAANCAPLFNDMGNTIADIDHDGDLDVFTSNIFEGYNRNVMLRNDTVGASVFFTDVTVMSGVQNTGWGWGTTFFDVNNDFHTDLAVTNGFRATEWPVPDQSRLFLNDGQSPPVFSDVSVSYGFDDLDWGSGLVAFDMDRDGDQDLLQAGMHGGPLRLRENLLRTPGQADPDSHYLVIQPRIDGPNYRAIGAEVEVTRSGQKSSRLITAGVSFLSQEPAEAHFGLGRMARADSVTVRFPSGQATTLQDVRVDQCLVVAPPPLTTFSALVGSVRQGSVVDLLAADDRHMQIESVLDPETSRTRVMTAFTWTGHPGTDVAEVHVRLATNPSDAIVTLFLVDLETRQPVRAHRVAAEPRFLSWRIDTDRFVDAEGNANGYLQVVGARRTDDSREPFTVSIDQLRIEGR